MIKCNDSWITGIKNELNSLGLLYLFEDPCTSDKVIYHLIESRIKDVYAQTISESPKGRLYQHLIDHFTLQSYLWKPGRYTHDRREK